jgi:hypothetical protein
MQEYDSKKLTHQVPRKKKWQAYMQRFGSPTSDSWSSNTDTTEDWEEVQSPDSQPILNLCRHSCPHLWVRPNVHTSADLLPHFITNHRMLHESLAMTSLLKMSHVARMETSSMSLVHTWLAADGTSMQQKDDLESTILAACSDNIDEGAMRRLFEHAYTTNAKQTWRLLKKLFRLPRQPRKLYL